MWPAVAAYCHSASVGNRYERLVCSASHSMYLEASSQLTRITGRLPLPACDCRGAYSHPPNFHAVIPLHVGDLVRTHHKRLVGARPGAAGNFAQARQE